MIDRRGHMFIVRPTSFAFPVEISLYKRLRTVSLRERTWHSHMSKHDCLIRRTHHLPTPPNPLFPPGKYHVISLMPNLVITGVGSSSQSNPPSHFHVQGLTGRALHSAPSHVSKPTRSEIYRNRGEKNVPRFSQKNISGPATLISV